MRISYRLLLASSLIVFLCTTPLFGQYEYDENSKLNTNLGFPVTVPAGSTSEFVTFGTGMVAGAGYNFKSAQRVCWRVHVELALSHGCGPGTIADSSAIH